MCETRYKSNDRYKGQLRMNILKNSIFECTPEKKAIQSIGSIGWKVLRYLLTQMYHKEPHFQYIAEGGDR